MKSTGKSNSKGRRAKFPIALKVLKSSPAVRVNGPAPVRKGTRTKGAYLAGGNGVHVFRFADLEPTSVGGDKTADHYANTRAVVIEGRKLMVGLAHEKRGMGSRPHHHPNDQFNFVLKGTLRARIGDGEEVLVPAGSVIYFPAGVVHSSGATADEDVVFYVCKDVATSMVGTPVDGTVSGPKSGFAAAKK
jgi:quercetin dioxygenase-like cupin family protein